MSKRIFLTLNLSASSGFEDSMYKYIFYDTLKNMGNDVVLFTYQEATKVSDTERTNNIKIISENIYQNFISHHLKKPFDLFFSYYHSKQVVPELFKQIRDKVFCLNYTTNFHQIDQYLPLLKEANLSIYVSKVAENYFINKGLKGYYMPFAGLRNNLDFNKEKNGLISFIGTSYGPRANYIWRCLQNNLPINIYGTHWIRNHAQRAKLRALKLEWELITANNLAIDTVYQCLNDIILNEINTHYSKALHNPLSDKDYNALLSDSSIVLNFPESRFGHNYSNPNVLIGANLRDFEVPTRGSFLLTQDSEEIRSFFNIGQEIETFNNEWEMIDKAKYYIKNSDLVLKIAEAGHKRVLKEHLWEHRFKALFTNLEQNYL